MTRISIEKNEGSGAVIDYWGHVPVPNAGARNLVPRKMMLVTVASFTFRFISAGQIKDCLAYYEQKIHPSSMRPIDPAIDRWECQRWFERLPMYLMEEPKHTKVVEALKRALASAEVGAFSKP